MYYIDEYELQEAWSEAAYWDCIGHYDNDDGRRVEEYDSGNYIFAFYFLPNETMPESAVARRKN